MIVGISLFVEVFVNSGIINYFKNFTVTIVNKSDHDIIYAEAGVLVTGPSGGVVESGSKDTYPKTIRSGKSATFEPKLSLTVDGSRREGGIYLDFEDASGNRYRKMVCSYTEILSGSSKVIVSNEEIVVEQDCF